MKRLSIFLVLALLLPAVTRGEEFTEYKFWNEGKLTWDDFQDTLSLKSVPSAFVAFLQIEKTKSRDGNTSTVRNEAQACFDKRHSFADPTIRTENQLRLFQLKYDLLEFYRRRLQTELNLGVVGIEADNRTRQYMDLYKEQSQKAEEETEHGQNEERLQEWEFYVTTIRISIPAPAVPHISPRRFGYGFYLGTGASWPVGDIARYWDPAWQIHFGFDLGYANTHLLCDFSAGMARTRRDINVQKDDIRDTWYRNGHNTYTSISLSLGQQLVSTKYFALMPYAGASGRATPIRYVSPTAATNGLRWPTPTSTGRQASASTTASPTPSRWYRRSGEVTAKSSPRRFAPKSLSTANNSRISMP